MRVFLLAHQDDEIFLLPHIMDSEQKLFIYLTSGVSEESSRLKLDRRTREAKAVFQKYLAGRNAQAIWWGLENLVPEGALHKYLSEANLASIERIVRSHGARVTQIITTTFEGAHQDHDSAAVVSRKLAKIFQVNCTEISTYPQWFSRFYSFKVLNPKAPDERLKFARFKTMGLALKLMASYKTQRTTWLGLGPATLLAYAIRPYQASKPAHVATVYPCFYEFRGRSNQREVLNHLNSTGW